MLKQIKITIKTPYLIMVKDSRGGDAVKRNIRRRYKNSYENKSLIEVIPKTSGLLHFYV